MSPPRLAMNRRTPARAFTLIELLAVIVIASMVTAIGAVSIASVGKQSAFVRTMATLEQMDARGRMHTRMSGSAVTMVVDSQARQVRLIQVAGAAQSEWLAEEDIAPDIALTLETSAGDGPVVFDRLGASIDYAVIVRDDVRAQRLQVAGLTGDVVRSEVER